MSVSIWKEEHIIETIREIKSMSKKYIEINRIVYDQLADVYENRRNNPGIYEEKKEFLGNTLLKYIDRAKGQVTVAEIGPGTGQMLAFFEENNCRTIGIELSEKMAQIAKKFSPDSILINNDVNDVMLLPGQLQAVYIFEKEDYHKSGIRFRRYWKVVLSGWEMINR